MSDALLTAGKSREQLLREDLQVQFDAILRSVEGRHYATARAYARGVMLLLSEEEWPDV